MVTLPTCQVARHAKYFPLAETLTKGGLPRVRVSRIGTHEIH